MTDPPSPPTVPRLLTGAEVRAAAAKDAPGYGRELSEADWERIADRLEALARLLWEFSRRQVEAETRAQPRDLSENAPQEPP
jgi:hypothetical protein